MLRTHFLLHILIVIGTQLGVSVAIIAAIFGFSLSTIDVIFYNKITYK